MPPRIPWPLLVPVLLAFAGVYFMLPRARRSKPVLGAVLAGLGLIVGGATMIRIETVLPERFLFYAFAGSAITGGVLLITQRNPVHAALSFALVVLSTCGLFLLLGAPFLMAATAIVYAGAIVVTFLFVIMLAQQAGTSDADRRSREPFLSTLAGFVLIGATVCVLDRDYLSFDRALDQVSRVASAQSVDEVIAVLGDPALRGPENPTHPLVDTLAEFLPDEAALTNLEVAWQGIRQPNNLANIQVNSQRILELAKKPRATLGMVVPPATLPLSELSGTPSTRTPRGDAGTFANRLPARNVAALGTSLFTDYLVAVELAGVLLLVATIGAIAIANRRAEGLR